MEQKRIAIIGLGYVGLPLAVEFAKKFQVVGFDINAQRIKELRNNEDVTLETTSEELESVNVSSNDVLNSQSSGLWISNNLKDIVSCNFYVVTVPTPVDKNNRPDLTPLYKASETVGNVLSKGDIVVYESTVFPGATEDECRPILEKCSGLTYNQDFFVSHPLQSLKRVGDHRFLVEREQLLADSELGERVEAGCFTACKHNGFSFQC